MRLLQTIPEISYYIAATKERNEHTAQTRSIISPTP